MTKKLEGNKILKGRDPNTVFVNRYSKIHILFRELAEARGTSKENLSSVALKVKRFWKDFYGVGSLTELSDEELYDIERLVEERIKAVKAQKN